ncbi:MAG: NTP transferase domain-containing protein, partial [Prevotella sp.]|nr:NTP transferase domain-containing protein [Prevotella sp.]MCM1075259.1 NTP transferase domain-containing protein [Ruminococcus sp.]
MKAFVLAAGLGTRLKPWTLSHPKALVPVGGVPMLERVLRSLENQGFDYIVVNIHHFGEQIIEFINSHEWKARIEISDERDLLLDTGGALVHAASLLCKDNEPFLVHNVDILSDTPLGELITAHTKSNAEATLLVSNRDSSRMLLFDNDMNLRAWKNMNTGQMKGESGDWPTEMAFSGIHVISPTLVNQMKNESLQHVFPIMDYYLSHTKTNKLIGYQLLVTPHIIDIGKPHTLEQANQLYKSLFNKKCECQGGVFLS